MEHQSTWRRSGTGAGRCPAPDSPQPLSPHSRRRSALNRITQLFGLLALVLTGFAGSVEASHLAGGDITVQNLTGNTYRVTLTIYRDCSGINLVNQQNVSVTQPSNPGIPAVIVSAPRTTVTDITPLCPGQVSICSGGTAPGIEEHVYEVVTTLNPLPAGQTYSVGWESCCRNPAITTLTNPSTAGFYLETIITPGIGNSSPTFLNVPIATVCLGQQATISPNASDADGDALVYSLSDCFGDPNLPVIYNAGITSSDPLAVDANGFILNTSTGELTFTPNAIQVGVICLTVEEFRNGVKIGEIRRDIQVRVEACNNAPPALTQINNQVVPVGQQFCAIIEAFDFIDQDNITVTATSSIGTFVILSSVPGITTGQFCFTPSIADAGQTYTVTVQGQDDACPAPSTGSTTFNITVPVPCTGVATATGTDASCINSSNGTATVSIQNFTPPIQYSWSNGGFTQSISGLTPGTYTVVVVDANACVDSANVFIGNGVSSVTATATPTDASCGASNGTVTAAASNGQAPYTYTLAGVGSNSTGIFTGVAGGFYVVNVVDAVGCDAVTTVTVGTANDVTAPVLTPAPANATVACDAVPAPGTVTGTDDCDANVVVNFSEVITNGNCPQNYTIDRTWSAIDGAGNTASVTQVITVQDLVAPVVTCPTGPITAAGMGANCGATVSYPAATATDNCGQVALTYSQASGTFFPLGTTTVVVTATDECGNASNCSFDVVVTDNSAPTISCPPGLFVSCPADIPAVDLMSVTTSDNCPGEVVTHIGDASNGGSGCGTSPEVIVRTYQVSDLAGNTDTCIQTITAVDSVPPVITCPAALTLNCGDDTSIPATGIATAVDNCTSTGGGSTSNASYTLADANGNTMINYCGPFAPCFGVQPDWGQATLASVGGSYTLDAIVDQFWRIEGVSFKIGASVADFNLNGSVPVVDASWTTISFANNLQQSITQTFSIPVNTCGLVGVVIDIAQPSQLGGIDQQSRRQVYLLNSNFANDPITNTSEYLVGTCVQGTSGNGPVITSNDLVVPGCGNTVAITRTFTAEDACGNTSSCDQTITTVDNVDPVVTCPGNITVNSDAGGCDAVVTFSATATDNCGSATVSLSTASGSTFPIGTSTVTATATDACGNSAACSFDVVVNDNDAPTIACPADVNVSCAADVPAANIADVTASDNCPGVVVAHVGDTDNGGAGCPGSPLVITREYSATDASGNTAMCTQIITVEDQIPPVITCPAALTLNCGDDTSIPATGIATAVDNCTSTGGGSTSNASYTLADANGNTMINYCGPFAPCFGVQPDWGQATLASVGGSYTLDAIVDQFWRIEGVSFKIGASVADFNLNGSVPVVDASWTTISFANNLQQSITQTFSIPVNTCGLVGVVIDIAQPSQLGGIDQQSRRQVYLLNSNFANDPITNTSEYLVGTCVQGTSGNGPTITSSDVFVPACGNTGTITRTFTAEDACGNTSSCDQTITTVDNVDPIITCPTNVTVNNDPGQCNAVVNFSANASDNCGATPVVTYTDAPGSTFPVGQTSVTATATDDCGNTASCSFTVQVNDNEAPVLVCPNDTTITCELDSIPADPMTVGVNDNCGIQSLVLDSETNNGGLGCANDPLVFTRVYQAVDVNGNIGICSHEITVIDTVVPIVTCPADTTISCDVSSDPFNTGFATGFDNCEMSLGNVNNPLHPSIFPCGSAETYKIADSSGSYDTDFCQFCGGNYPEWGTVEILNDSTELVIYFGMGFGWLVESVDYLVGNASQLNLNNGLPTVGSSWSQVSYPGNTQPQQGYIRIPLSSLPANCNTIAVRLNVGYNDFLTGIIPASRRSVWAYSPQSANTTLQTPYAVEYCLQPCTIQTYPTLYYNDFVQAGNCGNESTITRTWSVEDLCMNFASCIQTINVVDTTLPTITCPADIVVANDAGVCGAVVNFNTTLEDNCDNIPVSTFSTASGSTFPTGTTPVMVTGMDDCGNTVTCSFNVTVNDSEAPVALCQDVTVQLDANGSASITTGDVDNGSTDNCGIASLSLDNDSFSCSNVSGGSTAATAWINEFHYDNDGGDQGEFVEIAGTAGLDLTGWSVVLYNGANGQQYSTLNLSSTLANTSNGFGFEVVSAPGIQNGAPDGIALVDNNGNVVEFISYESNSFAATNGPASGMVSTDINVSENGNTPVGFSLQLTGSGSNGGQFSWSSPSSETPGAANNGQSFLGTSANTVTLTVTDLSGNTSTCTANVTVEDSIAPTAICQDLTVQLDNMGNASITAQDVDDGSSDNCAIDNINIDNGSFDCINVGNNTVTLTVTDVNGNSASCASTVTVEDNVAPVAICQNITVQVDANGNAMITAQDVDNGSSDACGIASLSIDNGNFNCSSIGGGTAPTPSAWINEFHYDNDGGDQNEFVEVAGTAGFDLSGWSVVLYNGSNGQQYSTLNLSSTLANTSNGFGFEVVSAPGFQNGAPDGLALVDNNGNVVEFISYESSAFTASNGPAAGQTSTNIGVSENGNTPVGFSLQLTGMGSQSSSFTWSSPSSETPGAANNGQTFNMPSAGNTVTLTVTDVNGNASTCTSMVSVEDNIAPTALCSDLTVQLDANGDASITASDVDNGSSDNCAIASLTVNPNTFDCSNVGNNTVTLTVTDVNGNVSTCTSSVEVEDSIAPTAICQDLTVQLDANGNASITTGDVDNGSSDNCSIASLSLDNSNFDCSDVGNNTVTLTVTDVNSNSASCTSTVTVEDNIAPMALCQDITVQLDANGQAMITAGDVDNGSSDNCGIDSITIDNNTFDCNNVNGNTVTMTVTDVNGNASTCTSMVTVEDNIAPTALCSDLTVQLDANGNASITANDVDNGSSDNCAIASLTLNPNTFDCSNVGNNTATLTVEDVNGNISTCTSSIEVEDNVAPNAVCQNITVYLNNSGLVFVTAADIDGGSTDACGIATITTDAFVYGCGNVGNPNPATLTVTDVNGNVSTCVADITVEDTLPPVLSCQDVTVQLDANGNASIVPGDVILSVSDNCGSVICACDSLSQRDFDCDDVGVVSVVVTATDVNGNISTCTASVTVEDNIAPTAVCQDITVQLDANGNAMITASDVDGGSTDNCNVILSATPTMFDCSNLGMNTVTLTASDSSGNTDNCTANVTVEDNVAPTALCQDITVQLDANGNATITASDVDGGSSDNCNFTVSATPTSFDCSNLGSNTVTLTVTDGSGNTATCTADVTVEDNVAPMAVCQNITVQLDANGNATITASDVDGGSSDNCSIASLDVTPDSFDCSDVGTPVTVTLTVTDGSGNTDNCTAQVTVEDNVAPNALCQDITVYLNNSGLVFVDENDIDAGSNDACGIASISTDAFVYGCGNVGPNTATLTVTDVNGNVSTCTSIVTVEDTIPPVPICQDITISLDANGNASVVPFDLIASVSDNCGSVTCACDSLSQTDFDCDDIGVVTVTVIASDVNGNQATCTSQVTIEDNTAPNAVCQDITVQLDANGQASITASDVDGGSNDNCSLILSATPTTFDCSNIGMNSVTLTATDSSGNTSSCTANVTIEDNITPTAVCQDITVQLDANGQASITVSDVDGGSSDNCNLTLTANPTTFDCSNVGPNNVTLTATDGAGNSDDCIAVVTVEDNIAPSALCQDITVQLDANGNYTITGGDVDGGSTDNCSIASLEACSNGSVATCYTADFDADGQGNALAAGTQITTQLAGIGIANVSASGGINQAWIFDSSNPTGNDPDLGTPNQQYGGPGIGNGGGNNTTALGNLLIIQENNNTPDDNASGGDLVFTFTGPTDVNTVTIVDNEGNNSFISAGGSQVAIPSTGDNGIVTVSVNATGVTSLTVHLGNSGAVAELDYCSTGGGSNTGCNTTFTCADLGVNQVTLTVTDPSGNVDSCVANVTVEQNAFVSIACPSDIVTNCETGNGGAYVTWTEPTASAFASCGTPCPSDPQINGFIYMGEFNGHRYYCSNTSNFDWDQANAAAQAAGGDLVTINSAGENNWLANKIMASYVWIGYNDVAVEGTFEWSSGEASSYTNWNPGEPNNAGGNCCGVGNMNNADYAALGKSTSKWYDRKGCSNYEFVMEVPCAGGVTVTQIGGPGNGDLFPQGTTPVTYVAADEYGNTDTCSFNVTVEEVFEILCIGDITVPCNNNQGGATVTWNDPMVIQESCDTSGCTSNPQINGFIFMGEFEGHRYYCSNGSNFDWNQANAAAQAAGGDLITINSAAENNWIKNQIQASAVWIGYNDVATEGQFEWSSGEASSYTNWKSGEPNNAGGNCCGVGNLNNADYAALSKSNGQWFDRKGCSNYEFVMEVPCAGYTLEQIAGPASGTHFNEGTTTITYLATSANGDSAMCSFNVTVEECTPVYCNAYGNCSQYEWIDQVSYGSVNNVSGNDNGYGDYTNMSATFAPGDQVSLNLTPGFSNSTYDEYWRVWVDWNRDGDFNDAGEKVFEDHGSSAINGSFTVPSGAASGSLRMRVTMRWDSYSAGPCCNIHYGEIEDYTVQVVSTNARTAPGASASNSDDNQGQAPSYSSVDENLAPSGFEFTVVHPNPVMKVVSGEVNIEFRSGRGENVKVSLMDLNGRVLQERTMEGQIGPNRTSLDVSDFAVGTYILRIAGEAGSKTTRLVIH